MKIEALVTLISLTLAEFGVCWFLTKKTKKLQEELTETQNALKAKEALNERYTQSESKARKNKTAINSGTADERLSNAADILRNNQKSRNKSASN